jgi:hypothetical protein
VDIPSLIMHIMSSVIQVLTFNANLPVPRRRCDATETTWVAGKPAAARAVVITVARHRHTCRSAWSELSPTVAPGELGDAVRA